MVRSVDQDCTCSKGTVRFCGVLVFTPTLSCHSVRVAHVIV